MMKITTYEGAGCFFQHFKPGETDRYLLQATPLYGTVPYRYCGSKRVKTLKF